MLPGIARNPALLPLLPRSWLFLPLLGDPYSLDPIAVSLALPDSTGTVDLAHYIRTHSLTPLYFTRHCLQSVSMATLFRRHPSLRRYLVAELGYVEAVRAVCGGERAAALTTC
jgi:hypothetical protein